MRLVLVARMDGLLYVTLGAEQSSVDALSFDTLVPKSILQRYISLLLDHRRIILCGSSGTAKTYMARRFAEHLIVRYDFIIDCFSVLLSTLELYWRDYVSGCQCVCWSVSVY